MSQWLQTFPGYAWVLTTAKKIFGGIIQAGPTPRHVGLIMDGNRRYARSHNIELKEGHNLGFESMASILEILYESGVETATVYAFSIENFKRLSLEVKWLMDLAKLKFTQITQHGDLCEQYGVRIRVLGNVDLLPQDVQEIMAHTEEITKHNTRATLNVCFPYTSRDEMTHAIKEVVGASTATKDLNITEETIEKHLHTKDSPPLDLLIRTSGTYRLLDFLLWQCVPLTCLVVVLDKLWPEFTPYEMAKILVNWGFNKYWYNSGSGYSVRGVPRVRRDEDEEEDEEDDLQDSEESNENGNSDTDSIVRAEIDTMTSQESEDGGRKH